MPQTITRFSDERGQTMSEYALLLVLVAIVVIAAFPAIVTALTGFFSAAGAAFGGS